MGYFQKRCVGCLEQGAENVGGTKAMSVESRGVHRVGNQGHGPDKGRAACLGENLKLA